MKKVLFFLAFVFIVLFANARVFYIAPNGNDSRTETEAQNISTPWLTLYRANISGLLPGDIVYLRGGTYFSNSADSATVHFKLEGLVGMVSNSIKIWAYPGEKPIFNLSNINPTKSDPRAFLLLDCAFVHLKGIRITNFKQSVGGLGISRGFTITASNNCTIENLEIDNIGGVGFKIEGSGDNLILNCDVHNIGDGLSDGGLDAWDNGDGYSCSGGDLSTRNTYEGCRAWLCCDDGWDFFDTNGINTLKFCWSFWNGYKPWGSVSNNVGTPTINNPLIFQNDSNYIAGNGEGFKLGPSHIQDQFLVTKYLYNCLAFENRGRGYSANSPAALTTRMLLYNNIAFKNDNDGFAFGNGWSTGISHIFKNNWSWNNNQKIISGSNFVYDGLNTNISNNSWDLNVNVDNSDFFNISSNGVDGPRQANGSLPDLIFLKLIPGSDLINTGLNVGLPFISTAPDLGAFEFKPFVTVPVTLIDFTASDKSGKSLLQWSTSTEINSSHFEVERSTDGRNFETIGTINANGNTNTRTDYQLYDYSPATGVNYYRLKIADKDGQFEYSKTVSIVFKNENSGSVEIKSAVINNKNLQLNIISTKKQSVNIGLYDDIGREIFVSNIQVQKGLNVINKVVTQPCAVYYFKLKTNEETIAMPLFNKE